MEMYPQSFALWGLNLASCTCVTKQRIYLLNNISVMLPSKALTLKGSRSGASRVLRILLLNHVPAKLRFVGF